MKLVSYCTWHTEIFWVNASHDLPNQLFLFFWSINFYYVTFNLVLFLTIARCSKNPVPHTSILWSQSKKILDAQFDKLPFHGLGKEMTANWWKFLANQLIVKGMYKQLHHTSYH